MVTGKIRNCLIAKARLFVPALALILLLGSLTPISAISSSAATPDDVKWTRVNLPANGDMGNWVLAAGSDIKHLTLAGDGSLYAYANPSGTSDTLFKSTDNGHSWSSTGDARGSIVGIAVLPDDASSIYYATVSNVFKSADAGKTFAPLPSGPGGSGSGNITITSIDVTRLNSKILVAVGTADNDSLQYGGIYIMDESRIIPDWQNTGLAGQDVSAVVFSPNYISDRQILAITTNETDTFVNVKIGDGGWNQVIGRAVITGRAARAAMIVFPPGYDTGRGEYTIFAAIDTGSNTGGVFKIKGESSPGNSIVTDLNVGRADNLNNIDITSLAVTGLATGGNTSSVYLLAGASGSNRVYISKDGGVNWIRSLKEPTGQSKTYVLMSPDFSSSGTAYAGTTGADSAFSCTQDGGATWTQIGLMDTRISSNCIIDLAISPVYNEDGTLFMLTFDAVSSRHSLWKSRNQGANWERVFSSSMANVDSLSMVEISPGFGKDNQTLFVAGSSNGNPAMWKSADSGQTFTYRIAPSNIDTWRVIDDNRMFFGSSNVTNGVVYSTENGGYLFSSGVAAGTLPLKSIALSPNYERDGTIMVGNNNGWVYYSSDNGTSFKPLPRDAVTPPLTGTVAVIFDADFANNKTVYAASNSVNRGIYRFITGKSTKWERIGNSLPSGGTISQLVAATGNRLYAVNTQSVNNTAAKGGIERSLSPASSSNSTGLTFETVTTGLDDGVNLSGLWLQGTQLWSIDTQNTRVMTFPDSLAQPVTLTSPADKSTGTGTSKVTLKWGMLSGATDYHWQIDYDDDFSGVPAGFEGDTKANSARLTELDSETMYYWRVRATKPLLSPWSAVRSFTTTGLGAAVVAPELFNPKAGAEGVPLKPVFQWSAISGAGSYEMMVASDISFANPAVVKTGDFAISGTAWQSNISLDYQTTYYWKVRAAGAGSYGDWSSVGAFVTQPVPASVIPAVEPVTLPSPIATSPIPVQPPQPVSPPSQTPQAPSPVQSAQPGWFPYLMGAMMMAIVILLVTILVLILVIKRR